MPVSVYLRNYTNEVKEVKLKKYKGVSKSNYLYEDVAVKLSYELHESFSKKLNSELISEETIVINIPAQSTLYLEKTMNFRSINYKSIEIEGGIMLLDSTGHYNKEMENDKEGLSKYYAWYDIK